MALEVQNIYLRTVSLCNCISLKHIILHLHTELPKEVQRGIISSSNSLSPEEPFPSHTEKLKYICLCEPSQVFLSLCRRQQRLSSFEVLVHRRVCLAG